MNAELIDAVADAVTTRLVRTVATAEDLAEVKRCWELLLKVHGFVEVRSESGRLQRLAEQEDTEELARWLGYYAARQDVITAYLGRDMTDAEAEQYQRGSRERTFALQMAEIKSALEGGKVLPYMRQTAAP